MYILNERQEKLKNEVKAFVDREVIPAASEYDRSGCSRCRSCGAAASWALPGRR